MARRYQPLFGKPQHEVPLRECYDRSGMILDAIFKHSRRPNSRILDLGCCEGFFSLGLCWSGFDVIGVDNHQPNIDLCNELARDLLKSTDKHWNECGSVTFVNDEIGRFLTSLRTNFSVTLGLSIFHHLCHDLGLERTRELIVLHATRCPLLIVELALKSENEYWSDALPEHEIDLIAGYSHIEKIGESRSHLGGMRPLYACLQ